MPCTPTHTPSAHVTDGTDFHAGEPLDVVPRRHRQSRQLLHKNNIGKSVLEKIQCRHVISSTITTKPPRLVEKLRRGGKKTAKNRKHSRRRRTHDSVCGENIISTQFVFLRPEHTAHSVAMDVAIANLVKDGLLRKPDVRKPAPMRTDDAKPVVVRCQRHCVRVPVCLPVTECV